MSLRNIVQFITINVLQLFMGNIDNSELIISRNYLPEPVMARFMKFYPQRWLTSIALRVELYGCPAGDSCSFAGLSLSFNSPVALIFTPVANLLLYGWIVSTTGQLSRNIKDPSNILSCNRCYGLQPLLTTLLCIYQIDSMLLCFCSVIDHRWRQNTGLGWIYGRC